MIMQTNTENVILIREDGRVTGFISRAVVYGCQKLDSDDIARLIDPEHGVISRAVQKNNDGKV